MNRCMKAVLAAAAVAASQLSWAGDWQVRVGPVAEKFNYTEAVDRSRFSTDTTEDGALYGLSLKLARRIGQFEVEGGISHRTNTVDFNGVYVNAATGAEMGVERKDSKARITEAAIRLARWFLATNNRVALYGGFGYRQWDRDVETSDKAFGTIADYAWPYLMAGAKFSLHKTERMSVMFDLRITKPINPKVELAFKETTAPVTLDLGSEIGFRFEAPVSYKVTATGGIEVVPFYERIKLKESDSEQARRLDVPGATSSVNEPSSVTESYGLNINWLQEF